MALRFTSIYKWLIPRWYNKGDGELVLHSIAYLLDGATERLRQGTIARFPSLAGASGLKLLSKDRAILRGRVETDAHYAARLTAWRYPRGHRVRGSAFALLTQVSEYFGGVGCNTIDASGTRHDRTADGVESYSYGNSWTWDAAGDSEVYRFWVGIDGTSFAGAHPDIGSPLLWGGAFGVDGYTVGQLGVEYEDVAALRGLLTGGVQWKPAGTQPEWIILSFDGSDPTPDASWEHWSQLIGTSQVRARNPAYRYWSLDPDRNNTYAGDPDLFCSTSYMPSGAFYGGDPDNFPASVTLYDGSTYAGNPDNFPSSVRLVDDGDPTP